MRILVSKQSNRRIHVLMVLIGVLSMLLMPVDYRGGAAVSHPHATIQLIADLAGGSLNHHANPRSGHTHPVTSSVWSPLGPLTAGLVSSNLSPEPASLVATAHTAATIADLSALAGDALVVAPSFDAEELTPWASITGKYVLYALVLPPLMLLAWVAAQRRFDRQTSQVWRGVLSAPEPPPPRRSAFQIVVTP